MKELSLRQFPIQTDDAFMFLKTFPFLQPQYQGKVHAFVCQTHKDRSPGKQGQVMV